MSGVARYFEAIPASGGFVLRGHDWRNLASHDGVTIAWDGLVYGLRGETKFAPRTGAAEIGRHLLQAYRKDPEGFFARLDGQCAIAVHDGSVVRAYRGTVSEAQIYYGREALSNRLRPVYDACGRPARDLNYFYSLFLDVPGLAYDSPDTPLSGITRLLPGTAVKLQLGKTPECTTIAPPPTYRYVYDGAQKKEDVAGHVRELLSDAVDVRLADHDGPVVCELSGGLDSSFITSLVASKRSDVTAYMYSFPKFPSHRFSEGCARKVAEKWGIKLHVLGPDEITDVDASQPLPYRDEPTDFFWQGALLSPAANRVIPSNAVLFGGTGADQLFIENPAIAPWLLSQGRVGDFWKTISTVGKKLSRSRAHLTWQSALMVLPRDWYRRLNRPFEKWRFSPFALQEMDSSALLLDSVPWLDLSSAPANVQHKRKRPEAWEGKVPLEFSYLTTPQFNTIPFYEPRGIQLAHPFFDSRVIDYMLSDVSWHLVHDWTKPYKHLLREAMTGLVPEEVRNRPRNEFFFNGFQAQYLKSNQTYLRNLIDEADLPDGAKISRGEVRQAFDQALFGLSSNSANKVINLLGYLIWWRDFQTA